MKKIRVIHPHMPATFLILVSADSVHLILYRTIIYRQLNAAYLS